VPHSSGFGLFAIAATLLAMNSIYPSIATGLKRLSPRTTVVLGLLYIAGVASVEVFVPDAVRVSLLYVVGIAVVAFRAGRTAALTLALLAGIVFVFTDPAARDSGAVWTLLIRFLVLAGVGWLIAEAVARAEHLAAVAKERSSLWEAEAHKHQATAARLSEALTERKQAEEALRESETRYRTLAESSLDAIFILGQDGNVQYLNSAAAEIFGRPAAELVGKTQAELFPDNIAGRHKANLQRLFETGTSVLSEEHVPFTQGHRWFETRLVPLRDGSGTVMAAMGMARDIAGRKRSEAQLQAQRDLAVSLSLTSDLKSALGRLLEVAVEMEGLDCGGVYLVNADTGEIELTTHVGLTQEFVEAVSRYTSDAPQTQLVMAGKPVYALHETLRNKPDREQLLALAVLPLMHEGKVIGALNVGSHTMREIPGSTRAIIEAIAAQASGAVGRLRAEEALQRSEARLRAIITGAPLIVLAADRDGRVVFEDGQALKAIGSPPGSNVGRNLADVFRRMPAILEDVRRVLSGEEFSSIVQVDSHLFDCWFSPIRGRDGKVEGCIGVATNVTERQRLQRQILEISDREQARIGQDIHDGLCQQLVSLAFDANSLENRLTSAGHPEAGTAKRIADLLDEAITQSRQLSRGLFPIRLEAEGLASALEELARSTQERFGVRCRFKPSGRVPVADNIVATHLYRIAQEAVTNAVKHAHPRRITIALRADARALEVKVDDDGTGLAQEEQSQPAGMGLHIMNYRARSIGGSLRLFHGAHGGTTVSCQVPQPGTPEVGGSPEE
jgi:PAS domain S-box-containing protein